MAQPPRTVRVRSMPKACEWAAVTDRQGCMRIVTIAARLMSERPRSRCSFLLPCPWSWEASGVRVTGEPAIWRMEMMVPLPAGRFGGLIDEVAAAGELAISISSTPRRGSSSRPDAPIIQMRAGARSFRCGAVLSQYPSAVSLCFRDAQIWSGLWRNHGQLAPRFVRRVDVHMPVHRVQGRRRLGGAGAAQL